MRLSEMSRTKSIFIAFLVVIFAFVVTLPLYGSSYYLSLLMTIFLYTILTVAWSMFSAPTGYMSLGSAAFLGIGAYTTAVLGKHLPLPLVIIAGGIISLAFALLVGVSCLRLRGVYFAIFTFGLTELILNSVLFYEIEVNKTVGRLVVSLAQQTVYYSMFAILIVLLLTVFLLGRSRYGLALRSIGQAEEAAAHTGVNVNAVKVYTFALSAFFMGVTGAIIVTQWSYVDARIAFNMFYSFMPVLMAIFGGLPYVPGQVLGAVALTLIEESLALRFTYHYRILFGVLIVAFILFFPAGVLGLFESAIKRLRRSSGRQYANP